MSDSLAKRAWIEQGLGYRFLPELKLNTPAAPAPTRSAVTYAKSRLGWLATRQKIWGEIEKLRGGLIAAFQGFDIDAELHSEYTQFVAPVIAALDTNPVVPLAIRQTLTTTLTALAQAVH